MWNSEQIDLSRTSGQDKKQRARPTLPRLGRGLRNSAELLLRLQKCTRPLHYEMTHFPHGSEENYIRGGCQPSLAR
jgi:hypothetical protein